MMERDLEKEREDIIQAVESQFPESVRDALKKNVPIQQPPTVTVTTSTQGTARAGTQ